MTDRADSEKLLVFSSALGWIALRTAGRIVKQLSFGHSSARAAIEAVDCGMEISSPTHGWQESLVHRIQAYAEGVAMDFRDVAVDPGALTPFWEVVVRQCREIPYGRTMSYGQLAARAQSPRAARAVGNCMARNRIPLIIPCHRVIAASGGPGPYSAPGGTAMKRRLLLLEARGLVGAKLG